MDAHFGTRGSISSAPTTTPQTSAPSSPMLIPVRGSRDGDTEYSKSIDSEIRTDMRERVIPSRRVDNICCVGAGYVGGPTASVIAFQNPHIKVTVVDKDAARVRKWNSKHLPIHEPGLSNIVRVARDGTLATNIKTDEETGATIQIPARTPNLVFSTDFTKCVSEADIVFLGVNTPTKVSGIGAGSATNMVALEGATREIAACAKPGAIIVEKSTVPCRTAQIIRDTLEVHRPGVAFHILSNPEFLSEASAIKDLLNPDRILIGSSQTLSGLIAAETLKNVYSAWVDPSKILTVNIWSSELSKLVANAMLAQRISSINTISAVCERTGADIDEVAKSIGLDPRLGPKFLKAGLGFGGSCFKKDILSLVYLAESLHLPEVGEYWMQVLKINEFQRNRFVRRVVSNLNGTLIGKKLAILGYAFKNNTSDTRESPAVDVVKSLLADNPAEIAIFDPRCNPEDVKDEISSLFATTGLKLLKPEGPIEVYRDSYEACMNASAILILTEWDQFRYPPPLRKESAFHKTPETPLLPTIIDPRPFTNPKSPTELEILALRQYQIHKLELLESSLDGVRIPEEARVDPLGRLRVEPGCAEDCRDCTRRQGEEVKASENVEWERVAYHMRKPKWVFDGRGIVDVKGMERLGFRVEVIGKAGTRSRLHGFDA